MDYGEFITELLKRSDIVRLVSRYTHLTRKGGTYWGCCPFHHEKTPSFTVSEDKGLYHCFGCKAGGNAISFISEIESVDRAEAVRILAKEAGMEVPQYKTADRNYAEQAKKRERLYGLMRAAARHYHENLRLPQAKPARDYLEKREVGDNLVKRFGLGYSVDGKEMIAYLEKAGYAKQEMKEAGIAAQRADEYYDVFYGRLIFPILNNLGEVVSFGGRVLNQSPDFAKYRNGSQTFIFDKSRNIYAVNLLKKRKQAEGLPYIIMTEGYMDVISLHKAGFTMAVASMGTSLTQTQAKLLKNYCDRIYISYDGDGAGQKATLRGLDILADAGFNVKVIELPDGLDPDDVIKQKGADFYRSLIENAVTLTLFKIKTLQKKYDMSRSDEKAKFAVEASRLIKALKNPVEQEEYLGLLHDMTGYTMAALYKQTDLSEPPAKVEPPAREQTAAVVPAIADTALRFVLASVLADKPYCDFTLDLYPYLELPLARRIYERGLKQFKEGVKSGLDAFFECATKEEQAQLNDLLDFPFLEGDGKEKYAECVRSLAVGQLTAQKSALAKQYDATKDIALLRQIQELDKKIGRIRQGATDDE
ncbi:MAG: DNA primase [Clostridia bacterium]|nr:DNA primase [Clostridia bacterium]